MQFIVCKLYHNKAVKIFSKIISRVAGPEEGTYGKEAASQRLWRRRGAPKFLWQNHERLGSTAHPSLGGWASWAWTIKPRPEERKESGDQSGDQSCATAGHADSQRSHGGRQQLGREALRSWLPPTSTPGFPHPFPVDSSKAFCLAKATWWQ